MANNGIDWEKYYGERWSEMTAEQKEMATVSMLSRLKKGQDTITENLEKVDKCVSKHEKIYYTVLIGGPIVVSILIVLGTAFINYLGR